MKNLLKKLSIQSVYFIVYSMCLVFLVGISGCSTKPYNPGKYEHLIKDEPCSTDYEVWVNGTKAIVYVARVQDPPWEKERTHLDFGGHYSFISFDMDKPVEVKIKSTTKKFENTILRPEGVSVSNVKKSASELSFTVDKPTKISIEPDGKNGPLLLFANTIDDFKPDLKDPNLIYFGPGIHHPDSAIVNVGANQTMYLAEGAIVRAGIRVRGNNVKICGRGIICGNEFVWGKGAHNLIVVTESNNVLIKDIILRGSATWTLPIRNSQNVTVDNVKIVAGRAQNDDGINPCNSQNVWIKNCFIRTDDDCIALKGLTSNNENVEKITVENCILWCDRARVVLMGHESRADYMRNILFKNIEILHFSMTAFLLEPGEKMKMENVVFENIRINGEGQKELIRLKPVVNQYMRTLLPGYISGITFKNITLTGKEGPYKIQLLEASEEYTIRDVKTVLRGANKEYTVKNVTFDNISILGQRLTKDYNNLEMGNYVSDITFK